MTGRTAASGDADSHARLAGCRVVVTREHPGELADLLEAAGAVTIHVPLIEVADPSDGGEALRRELARLADYDWLIVTSAAGADRVAEAAAPSTGLRLAAVGPATADALEARSGRAVDLVPRRHTARELAAAFVARHRDEGPQRVLLALADRAGTVLGDVLTDGGHDVTRVTAYRTRHRRPSEADRRAMRGADAVLLASGSAAEAWAGAVGPDGEEVAPRHVVAIGPTTAEAARKSGLKVTAVATDHTLTGLVDALAATWGPGSAL